MKDHVWCLIHKTGSPRLDVWGLLCTKEEAEAAKRDFGSDPAFRFYSFRVAK